jgi:hypothetical protein
MRESSQPLKNGIPAFAGMTNGVVFDLKKIKSIGKRYYLAITVNRGVSPAVRRFQPIDIAGSRIVY